MNPIKFSVELELQHYGICDSSGAIALGEGHFAVANDEDNILRIYQADRSGNPIEIDINDYFDNNPKQKETDIEAVAQLDDVIYWITSHGRNKSGEFRPERHQFFANKLSANKLSANKLSANKLSANKLHNADELTFEQVGCSYTQLVLADMFQDERLKCYQLKAAETLPPKEQGGLNIEGLTITPNHELLIGFRNPVVKGKALLLPLKNPRELVEIKGSRAHFGDPIELNLDGLGIRSIEYWERRQRYLIVAGAYDGSDEFALYQWSGLDQNPQRLDGTGLPADFRPEGLLFYPGREQKFQLLSDDGSVKRDGEMLCKDIKDHENPQKYFRSLWIRVEGQS